MSHFIGVQHQQAIRMKDLYVAKFSFLVHLEYLFPIDYDINMQIERRIYECGFLTSYKLILNLLSF
jgi:hypothetical protein